MALLVFVHRDGASVADSAMGSRLRCVKGCAACWRSARIPTVRYSNGADFVELLELERTDR
jgi:hypothetical protein